MVDVYSNGTHVTKIRYSVLLGVYYCDIPHVKVNKNKTKLVRRLKSLGYKKCEEE